MKRIVIVKGCSGSGKSTRVYQLLLFFEKLYGSEIFYYKDNFGKIKPIGILIKNLNIVFLGKKYSSGTLIRWQGYDVVTSYFKTAENLSLFLKNNTKYLFIIEGASVTQSNRLRPLFLSQIGYTHMYIQYYNYLNNNKEEYYARILLRCGRLPKKDVMWEKNKSFIQEVEKSEKEKIEINNKNCIISNTNYTAEVFDFGIKFLQFINLLNLKEQYINFVLKQNYISKNKYSNFSKKHFLF